MALWDSIDRYGVESVIRELQGGKNPQLMKEADEEYGDTPTAIKDLEEQRVKEEREGRPMRRPHE
ncbi:MAG: hypothetical protein ABIJ86_06705 [Spirochaetota bacterium]